MIERTQLGRTGLAVSRIGFGTYRVSTGVESHRLSLCTAIELGVNVIDTSANYADGGSEDLIGQTIEGMIVDGKVARQGLVVVSKGGYIQGQNFTIARERLAAGSGFPEVVEYAPGMWHCIHPEFLQDQITRSLNRLKLSRIDVYLLHNPEYFLSHAERAGIPIEDARTEYYRRIEDAFGYLEQEVAQGRIGWYGISSNTFVAPQSSAAFTSLSECVSIADRISSAHHFGVVQFPANLLEQGFVRERHTPDNTTVMDVAREHNLGVLVNRPLNGIVGESLIRIADFPTAHLPFNESMLHESIAKLVSLEDDFTNTILPRFVAEPMGEEGSHGVAALVEFVSVGRTMQGAWNTFESIEHYNDVLSQYFSPRLGYVAQYFGEHGTDADVKWLSNYVVLSRDLFETVSSWYARTAQSRSDTIRQAVDTALGTTTDGTLSSIAVRMLAGVDGVSSVLVGMRRESYVHDVVTGMEKGALGDEDAWRRMDVEDV